MSHPRRPLALRSLDDLVAEVDRLGAAQAAGGVRALGQWSPAQAVWHLARFLAFSIDGFPFRYAWYWRWLSRLVGWVSWRALLALAFRPGFRNPPGAAAVEPASSLQWAESVVYLYEQVSRLRGGARMVQRSPTGERLTHAQWVEAHLRHAELHLSFFRYPDAPSGEPAIGQERQS